MFLDIVYCAMVFFGVQIAKSAITSWTGNGTITGASGTIKLAAPLSEASAVGATVVSLTAATNATSITGYTVTGTPNAVVLANAAVGTVTLSAQVDYEANTELVLVIIATDDGGSTGTATVTVPIGDVPGPPFTTTTKELCAEDGLGPGKSVGDVSVSVAGGVVTYSDTDVIFDVDANTGAVTTAAGVTLDKATHNEHTVTITGTVTGGESNDITVTVTVGDCSGKEKMATTFGSLLLSLLAYTLLSL